MAITPPPAPQRRARPPARRCGGGGGINRLYADLERAGLSVATRRLTHAVLHRALRDAVRWGRVTTRNAADMADPPARGRSRAQAWTTGALRRFLEHVADDRLFALWRLAATTGMRRGELGGVTWRALDLDGACLSVEQQVVPTRGGVTFGPPKSSRSRRTVALDADTVAALRAHHGAQMVERALAGDAYDDGDLAIRRRARRPVPGCPPPCGAPENHWVRRCGCNVSGLWRDSVWAGIGKLVSVL